MSRIRGAAQTGFQLIAEVPVCILSDPEKPVRKQTLITLWGSTTHESPQFRFSAGCAQDGFLPFEVLPREGLLQ